jgi:hypothetical protein
VWREDEDGWSADGTLSFDITTNFELAVFQGQECKEIRDCRNEDHAKFMAAAFERTAIRNQRDGQNWRCVEGALL